MTSESGSPFPVMRESIKRFLGLLLISTVMIGCVGVWLFRLEAADEVAAIELREREDAQLGAVLVANHVRQLVGDLVLIGQESTLPGLFGDGIAQLSAIADQFKEFGETREDYAAIALVGLDGRYLLRLERAAGAAGVPHYQAADLNRPGQRDSGFNLGALMELSAGQVALFPSLSGSLVGAGQPPAEQGAFIAAFTPVVDHASGEQKGFLLVEDAPEFLGRLTSLGALINANVAVVDSQGNEVWGARPRATEAAPADEDSDALLIGRFPEEWERIQEQGTGQILGVSGLFTFRAIDLDDLFREGQPVVENLRWTLLTHVPSEILLAAPNKSAQRVWFFGVLVLALSAIGSWLLAHTWAQWRREQRLNENLVRVDTLTGLPNRALLFDRLECVHQHSDRYRRSYGLIYLSVDNFTAISEQFGHLDGNRLLVRIGNMLVNSLRVSDTVACLGGGEFVVLLSEVTDADAAMMLGNKVVAAIGAPIRLAHGDAEVSASVGVGLFPEHGSTSEQVLRAAEAGMLQAKREGGGRCVLAKQRSAS